MKQNCCIRTIVSGFLIVIFGLCGCRGDPHNLFETPVEIPAYIAAIAPYPGTTYPTDAKSIPAYSDFQTLDGNVCVRLNSLSIDQSIVGVNDAYSKVSLDKIDLFLNNQLVDNDYAFRATYVEDTFPIKGTPPLSGLTEALSQADVFIPIDICWELDLPNDLYLAKLVIQFSLLNGEEYEWAFQVDFP